MKNLRPLFLLFVAVSISFVGCSNDDDPSEDILGKWYKQKESYKTIIGGAVQEEESNEDFDSDDYIQFFSKGKGVDAQDGEEYPFQYSINKNGTELTVTDDEGYSDVYKIESLTDHNLVFSREESQGTTREIETFTLHK